MKNKIIHDVRKLKLKQIETVNTNTVLFIHINKWLTRVRRFNNCYPCRKLIIVKQTISKHTNVIFDKF